jgi:hypothetical protein
MTQNDVTQQPTPASTATTPPGVTTQQPAKHKSKTPLVSFISGGIAGITAKSVVSPLERVKILFQVKSQAHYYSSFVPYYINMTPYNLSIYWETNNTLQYI